MPRRVRFKLKQLSTCVPPKIHRDLSDISWALNRPISEMIREMIENDLPRFKDRHRKAIADGKNSLDSHEASDSMDL